MTVKTKKFHENIDLLGNLLNNWGIQTLTADPGTAYARLYYNSVSHTFRVYEPNAAAWSDLGSAFITSITDTGEVDLTVSGGALSAAITAIATSKITGFDTQVRTSTLNQMTAPTADLSINSHKLTNVTDPTGAQDAATKAYVDSLSQGVTWKKQVRAATTVNGALATAFANGQVIDGVTLATSDRILVKDQTSGAENGIYVVAASGAPTRATDADVSAEMQGGTAAFVTEGTANADSGWVMTNDGAVTLGTTALVFARFTGLSDVVAGTGASKTGNTLNVNAASATGSGGPGGGLVANADDLAIDTAIVVRKFASTIGDASTTDFVVTHNLGTRDIQVNVYDAASPFGIHDVYVEATSTNTCTIFFPTAPATNELRVVVQA